jgi:hypothetical protein
MDDAAVGDEWHGRSRQRTSAAKEERDYGQDQEFKEEYLGYPSSIGGNAEEPEERGDYAVCVSCGTTRALGQAMQLRRSFLPSLLACAAGRPRGLRAHRRGPRTPRVGDRGP